MEQFLKLKPKNKNMSDRKRTTITLVLMMILLTSTALAQNYKQAIGLRGGLFNGISYKNFVTNSTAVEGILHTRWQGWEVVGLIEYHNEMPSNGNFYWFYGYGAHLGFFDAQYSHYASGTYTVIGVDGILGLEYEFPKVPIAIGLDWKPYINLIGYSGFFGDGGAFSLRYTF